MYAREIVRSVLFHKATNVILAHNHPGGSPKPSSADLEVTKKLIQALDQINVNVNDHVIVAGKRAISMRSLYDDIFTEEQKLAGSRRSRVSESDRTDEQGRFLVEWMGRGGKNKVREFKLYRAAYAFHGKMVLSAQKADIWSLAKNKPVWEKRGIDGCVLESRDGAYSLVSFEF